MQTVNNHRPHGSKWLPKVYRQAIYTRDGGCVYCGATDNLSIDHIIPAALGGKDVDYHPTQRDYRGDRVVTRVYVTNLVTACSDCNVKRDQQPISTWCDRATLTRVLTQRYLPLSIDNIHIA